MEEKSPPTPPPAAGPPTIKDPIGWYTYQLQKRPIAALMPIFVAFVAIAVIVSLSTKADQAATATRVAASFTPTASPGPTATVRPTPAPPGQGATLTIKGWSIKLIYATNPSSIPSLTSSGKLWVYRIDATNGNTTTQSFSSTFAAHLTDDHGDHFDDLTPGNSIALGVYSTSDMGITDQESQIVPRGTATYALVFDVSKDAKPVDLQIEERTLLGDGEKIDFVLK